MAAEIIRQEAFKDMKLNVIEHEGQEWFTAEEIGKALGFSEPRKAILKIYERNKDEFEGLTSVVNLTTEWKGRKALRRVRVFNLQAVYKFGFFAETPTAKELRHWASYMITTGNEKIRARIMELEAAQPSTINADRLAALHAKNEQLKKDKAKLQASLLKVRKQIEADKPKPLALPAPEDPDKIPVSRQDLHQLYKRIDTKDPNSVYQAGRIVKAIIDGRPLPEDNYPYAHILDDDNLRDSSVWNLVQGIKEGKKSRDLSGLAEAALQELDTTAWVMWHSRQLYRALVLQTIMHNEEFIIRARQ